MLSDVDHKEVTTALIRGQDCANQVKKMIENGSVPPETLVKTVVDSISLALSLMNPTCPPPSDHESSSQNMAGPERRGPLKKKKSCGIERYIDHSSPLIEDGFTWRKYGSKIIKTSPHKRSYFRCSFAKDQNCKAKRQVQQIQDDPSLYRTIYEGQHMCKAPVFSHHVYEDTTDHSKMIQFDNLDQSISDLTPPQQVSVEQQNTIRDEAIDHIMTPEFGINDFVMDESDQSVQSWASQISPLSSGNITSDLSDFDYDRFFKDFF